MADPSIDQMRAAEAIAFQHRVVIAQRAGWVVMASIILAALVGLFGAGPLSQSQVASDDGRLVVDYPRFLRTGSTTTLDLRVTVDAPAVAPRIEVDTAWLSTYTIEDVQPEPDQVVAHGDRTAFVFAPPVGTGEVRISFDLRAGQFGPRAATIELAGSSVVTLSQFIYP